MAIQVEMWQPLIEEELYASNEFLNHFHNADEYVIGGKVVHIPQSGGASPVTRNRSTYPATARRRTDTDILYALDEFTTDPTHIPNADTVELSYDKTRSVIREDTGNMMEEVGDWSIYNAIKNLPAPNLLPTTGAASAASADGATGNRKIITEKDIRTARTLLNKQNVPKRDRYMLLSSEQINHLADDEKLKYAFQKVIDLPEGVIAKYAGFYLLERSKVAVVDNSQTIKVPGAASAVDDSELSLFWQKDFIERALGDVTMFDNYGRAEYYGDIFSFLIRAQSRARRQDNKGYGALYRAAV